MCNRCKHNFTIHNAKELKYYLSGWPNKKDILHVWLERQYFTNLIYLEYKYTESVGKNHSR